MGGMTGFCHWLLAGLVADQLSFTEPNETHESYNRACWECLQSYPTLSQFLKTIN